jgi:glycosyltransferase involved in cell wall biosynthesis
VHDWLYVYGGAERVLRGIMQCFPDADLFTLFDVLNESDRARIGYTNATTSFLQRMPGIAKFHRLYLPLMPLAIEQLDLSAYDVVISSSYAVAKGVLTGPDQLHISYVHSPMRYAWDLQHQYLAETRLQRGVKGALARILLHRMRLWDTRTASGVDAYAANSHFVARRIRKAYGRTAEVIHPPVEVPIMPPSLPRERFYLTASRLVPYKRVQAIVEAFRELPDERLIVVGDGPERKRIAASAGANVELLGHVPDAELKHLMATARAFIFAAEEDFGIVPVEAQGMGTPVIALGRGGVRETIVTHGDRRTGLFFARPEPRLIAAAVRDFTQQAGCFTAAACHENARRFSSARFEWALRNFVGEKRAQLDAAIQASRATSPAIIDTAAA